LNPGAPEFTPRTLRTTKPVLASPIRSDWAEDVEDEVSSPHQSPMRGTNPGPEWETHTDYPRAPPNTAAASPDRLDETIEKTPLASLEPRPRRNTLQSVSCPDPPLFPLQCSPSRSVSQPAPSPQAPSPVPVESHASETLHGLPLHPGQKTTAPKPRTVEAKASQGNARGRGPRGRGYRDRHRGKGRRNASNPKRNKRVVTSPQASAHSDPPMISAA
jgi:hypothetical protein